MASIKQINDRKFKITVSNGYRPKREENLQGEDHHRAGFGEAQGHPPVRCSRSRGTGAPGEIRFCRGTGTPPLKPTPPGGWSVKSNTPPALSPVTGECWSGVYPYIGAIKLGELRPMALENLLIELRKRTHQGSPSRKPLSKNTLPLSPPSSATPSEMKSSNAIPPG